MERLLPTSCKWQFDSFKLADVTGNHALSSLGFFLFSEAGLIKQFKLRPALLARSAAIRA